MSYVKADYDDDDDDNYNDSLMKLHRDCEYYFIDDMARFVVSRRCYQYIAIHVNIRSMPSKYDQLRSLTSNLRDIGMPIHHVVRNLFDRIELSYVPTSRMSIYL
jgi:hypothetical protein